MKNTDATNKTPKQSGQPLPPSRKHEYVYHWDRIIGTGVIFLVLCGLTGYGLYAWLTPSPEDVAGVAAPPPAAEIAVAESRPEQDKEPLQREFEAPPRAFVEAEEDSLPAVVAETTDSDATQQGAQTPQLNEAQIAADNPDQQFTEKKPLATAPAPEMTPLSTAEQTDGHTAEETLAEDSNVEDSDPAPGAQPAPAMPAISPAEELSEAQAEIPQDEPLPSRGESPGTAADATADATSDTNADRTPPAETLKSPFQLTNLNILMPSVKRFLLAESVANREPKGELSAINFAADGSAAVWVFSELINKRGSRLKYVWLHKGKQVATVRLNVGGNRWRSSSSKIINQSMRGPWRVELQDGKGRLLASADFFLR